MVSEVQAGEMIKGFGYDRKSQAFSMWNLSPKDQKPQLLNIQENMVGNQMVWSVQNTGDLEISQIMTHWAQLNEDKTKQLSERYTNLLEETSALSKDRDICHIKLYQRNELINKLLEELKA